MYPYVPFGSSPMVNAHHAPEATAFAINTPTQGLFRGRVLQATPDPRFPRIGYTFERVHAAANFLPIGEAFKAPGAVPDLAAHPAAVERLRREAQLAASVSHPGICAVFALEGSNVRLEARAASRLVVPVTARARASVVLALQA